MIGSLALTLVLQSANLDQKVDYRTVAKDIPLILADLRKQTGVKFDSRGLRDMPVIVVSRGLPLQTLMDRLAEVTDSVWSHENDRYILTRSPSRIQAARKLEMAVRGKMLKEQFLKDKKLLPLSVLTEDEARAMITADRDEFAKNLSDAKIDPAMFVTKLGVPSAAAMLLHEFVKGVRPDVLGSLEKNGVIIFSNRPAGLMRKMPVNLDSAISTYLKNRETLAKVAGDGDYVIEGRHYPSTLSLLKRNPGANPEIRVVLSSSEFVPFPSLELYVCADGKGIDVASVTQPYAPPPKLEFKFPAGHPLVLSRTSSEILKIFNRNTGAVASVEFSDKQSFGLPQRILPLPPSDLLTRLSKPKEFDPFSFFTSEWVQQSADALGESAVCAFPDHALGRLTASLFVAKALDTTWNGLSSAMVNVRHEDGILVVKPAQFGAADRYRVDRRALQEFLQIFARQDLPSLSDQIRYAEHAPMAYRGTGLDTLWIKFMDPNARVYEPYFLDQRMSALRFMGSLSPGFFETAQSNLDVSILNEAQFAKLEEWLQNSRNHVPKPGAYAVGEEPNSGLEFDLPRPVAKEGTVLSFREGAEGALVSSADSVLSMSASELGFRRGALPGNVTGFEPIPMLNSFREAKIDMVNVRVSTDLGESLYVNRPFLDVHGVSQTKSRYEDLPAAFRSRVDGYAKEAAGMRVAFPNFGGTSAPPPASRNLRRR